MGNIADFLWSLGWLTYAPIVIFVTCYKFLSMGTLWQNEPDRTRWINALNHDDWKTRYHNTMFDVLDWFNRKLSSSEMDAKATPARLAFSHGLINTTMLLAVAYPVLSLLVQWLFGSPLQIGNLPIAPAGSDIAIVFVIIWFLGLIFLSLLAAKKKPRLRVLLSITVVIILFGGEFASKQFGVPNAVALAVQVAFVGVLAGALNYPFAIIAIIIGAVIGIGEGALVGTFAMVGMFVGALYFSEHKNGKRPIFSLLYLAALLLFITLAIHFLPSLGTTKTIPTAYLLLFFAIFPITNALADFASTGLTRYLLHRGLTRATPINAAIDTLGGIVIFFLLGGVLITYIHLVRPADGIALLDLGDLFTQLEANRGDYWWLAIMLGSTLLPTFLHLIIGIATLALQYPKFIREWIVTKLQSGAAGSDIHGRMGSAAICAIITLAVWLPLYGFNWLFTLNHGALMDGVISVFHGYAAFIGAVN